MRIDKNTDSYLLHIHNSRETFNKMSNIQKERFYHEYIMTSINKNFDFFANKYEVNDYEVNKRMFKQLLDMQFKCQLINKHINIEYVCDSFKEAVSNNQKNLLDSFGNTSLIDLIKDSNGFLLFDNWCMFYAIEDNIFIEVTGRNGGELYQAAIRGDSSINIIQDYLLSDDEEYANVILFGLTILLFKYVANVETIMVGAGVRRKVSNDSDDIVVNKTPFPINCLDCSWFKTIIRTEGFMVRGFFRLQPYGVGRCERRLIYIKPFQKHGYVRTARKIVHERKAINS